MKFIAYNAPPEFGTSGISEGIRQFGHFRQIGMSSTSHCDVRGRLKPLPLRPIARIA